MTFEFVLGEEEYGLRLGLGDKECFFCKSRMFYSTSTPYVNGQVYSIAGLREVRISRTCETCFDRITAAYDD